MELDSFRKQRKAYLVGSGIGSLAAAAFMIRDGGMVGHNISIFETLPIMGGSLDGGGNAIDGYRLRGGRMFTFDNYECTWDLFKSIPSLDMPNQSVYEETVTFNERHKSNAKARLVDKNRHPIKTHSMGFSMTDRLELLTLSETDEKVLANSRLTDWLSPGFFKTNFWLLWSTTFAFQPWHSAVEFRRYLHRFILEFSRLGNLGGVKRTKYNQFDSMVRPLLTWLEHHGVHFRTLCTVKDIELSTEGAWITAKNLVIESNGKTETISLRETDLVFLQNGSMTDASSYGSMTEPPEALTKKDSQGWDLWEKIAEDHPELGHPLNFNSSIPESLWESFTVTLDDPTFFDAMEAFTTNQAGTGGLVTFLDSPWLMSIVLAHQPHFDGQPKNTQVFWGYALHPDRVGCFVAKTMSDCTGLEILQELCGHLNFDLQTVVSANCIPCRMPYITSMFMPRLEGDRPLPVPPNSRNLAFVSQFVEIPDDVVFTVEYSVRAAQMAVYQLLKLDRSVPPVHPFDQTIKAKLAAALTAFQ